MPIPKKPDELREMIASRVRETFNSVLNAYGRTALVDLVMDALDEYDPCFAKAAALGEPTFTLRAQDETSHGFLQLWGYRQLAARDREGSQITRERIQEVFDIADAMRAWPNRRQPD